MSAGQAAAKAREEAAKLLKSRGISSAPGPEASKDVKANREKRHLELLKKAEKNDGRRKREDET